MTTVVQKALALALILSCVGVVLCFFPETPASFEDARAVLIASFERAFDGPPWSSLPPLVLASAALAGVAVVSEGLFARKRHDDPGSASKSGQRIREIVAETRARAKSWLDAEPPDVIQAFDVLLRGAISAGASDIHFSPTSERLTITYRVEGTIHEVLVVRPELGPRLTVRAKVLAHLDTHVRNVPQDGRLVLALDGKRIEARMSSLPTDSGERVVLRLPRAGQKVPELEDLDFSPHVLNKLKELSARTQGILFVTGVVGSGKTTTMYAQLHEIWKRRGSTTSFVTLEDPIELELPFATQTQIITRTGMTFATALRSALRQDPNVLLVGEIRDQETASIALQAALTGHFIMTTVHANDAAGPFARLMELGVEPFVLASASLGCLSQRLVRTLCSACKRPQAPSPALLEQLAQLGHTVPASRYFEPVGCPACDGSGFSSRVPISELLIVDAEMRKAIIEQRPTGDMQAIAVKNGTVPLITDGLRRAALGQTSLAEVLRALG